MIDNLNAFERGIHSQKEIDKSSYFMNEMFNTFINQDNIFNDENYLQSYYTLYY